MKKLFLIGLLLLSLAACQSNEDEQLTDWVSLAREGLTALEVNTQQELILELEQQAQWTATVTFSSGDQLDFSDKVTWSSDSPTVVAVSSTGLITGLAEGTAQISATYKGFQKTNTVTVSAASLVSIYYSPTISTLDECTFSTFRARGSYSDGTTRNITKRLSWQSSDEAIAEIDITEPSLARLTAHQEGSVTITSTDTSGKSASISVTVEDVLSGMSITPSALILESGESAKFTASGEFNDGSFKDISNASEWTLASEAQSAVIELNNGHPDAGAVTALDNGEASVSATCGGLTVSQAATVTVSGEAFLTDIDFFGSSDPLVLQPEDSSEKLTLLAYYSDDSTTDVSETTTWTILTGDTEYISIGTAAGEEGNIILSDDIATITEDKSIVVRAEFEELKAYIEIIVEAP